MKPSPFTYNAIVESVHDGDTVTVMIDVGFQIFHRENIRMYGIDAPELSTPEGKVVASFMKDMLTGKSIVLETVKDKQEKFGRILGIIWLNDVNVNRLLVDEGKAKEYFGGKR